MRDLMRKRSVKSIAPEQSAVSIFEFDDYRAFLKAKFEERKRLYDFFSHRYFAQRAGFNTPSFLQFVMQGKRNLTLESIRKFARGFGLTPREARYFETLVLFNQADDAEDRRHYYETMLQLKTSAHGKVLEKAHYDYYARWYVPVIREMVSLPDFQLDPRWIQERLRSKVPVPHLRKAITLLKDLKIIEQGKDGRWHATDPVVTTGPQVNSIQVANYHRQMMLQAQNVINAVPADEREITSLTASLSRECFEDIREMIREFKQTLIGKIVNDKKPEQVVQIQFQMFPFIKKTRGKA
jgi:uncharacterized protein (TIGR02147 family)